jgi:hypothetical protein
MFSSDNHNQRIVFGLVKRVVIGFHDATGGLVKNQLKKPALMGGSSSNPT